MPMPRYIALIASAPLAAMALATTAVPAAADRVEATIHQATKSGEGDKAGTIEFKDTEDGLLITPDLAGISPTGAHGLHIHQKAECGAREKDGETVPAGAAGGHLDPKDAGSHKGPYGDGHLGDLPNLIVTEDSDATIPVLAPRLKVADLHGHAVMIHAGPDHYAEADSDKEKGGGRAYCGVIQG